MLSQTSLHQTVEIQRSTGVLRIKTNSGNSLDKLRHPRSDAYSAEQVLLNKQQIWCGGAYLDCYPNSCYGLQGQLACEII